MVAGSQQQWHGEGDVLAAVQSPSTRYKEFPGELVWHMENF
jgi:hypothetical protein